MGCLTQPYGALSRGERVDAESGTWLLQVSESANVTRAFVPPWSLFASMPSQEVFAPGSLSIEAPLHVGEGQAKRGVRLSWPLTDVDALDARNGLAEKPLPNLFKPTWRVADEKPPHDRCPRGRFKLQIFQFAPHGPRGLRRRINQDDACPRHAREEILQQRIVRAA